jgi:RNA polymerase sigma factor (sigma-70 family)
LDHEKKRELQTLMVRLSDGDRAAFDPIYEALWPLVHRFAQRSLGAGPDAEDAAQVAVTKLFSQATRFDPARDVVAWTLGIAAYECKTLRQKRRRRREDNASLDAQAAHVRDPEDLAISRQLEIAAREAMGTLSQADLDTLRVLLEEGQAPVASATFRKRVSRAVARLRLVWSSRHGD